MLEPSGLRTRASRLESRVRRDDHRRRRRAVRILVTLVVVMLLIVGAGGAYYVYATSASGPSEPVRLEIPKGATTTDIGRLLEDRGIIRSALMFRLLARLRGLGPFAAGDYAFATNMDLDEAFVTLGEGPEPLPTVRLSVPEGFRIEQTAKAVEEQLGVDRKRFLDLARSGRYSLPPYLPEGTKTLEGFLFPKTYEFIPENVSAERVAERLLAQFEREVAGLPWENAKQFGLTPYEVVILASLVEEEARVPQDRGKIARVMYNRLKLGMKLEIDATVQYIDPDPSNGITVSDLAIDSPYNTRLNPGIPPTPIASPGRAALEATLKPTPGPWLYFVVIDQETGEHGFTDDYDEFLRMKEQGLGG